MREGDFLPGNNHLKQQKADMRKDHEKIQKFTSVSKCYLKKT